MISNMYRWFISCVWTYTLFMSSKLKTSCPINLLAVLLFCGCTTDWPWKDLFDDRYPHSSQGEHWHQVTGQLDHKIEVLWRSNQSLQSMTMRPKKGKVMEPTWTTGTTTVLIGKLNHSRFVHVRSLGLGTFKQTCLILWRINCKGENVQYTLIYTDTEIHRNKNSSEIKTPGKPVVCGYA